MGAGAPTKPISLSPLYVIKLDWKELGPVLSSTNLSQIFFGNQNSTFYRRNGGAEKGKALLREK